MAAASTRWMARFERSDSLPPRRIEALPLFRHRAATSLVTLGRDSKMVITTPSGTRTRSIRRPFGRT